jgi:hypothetical protein
MSVGLGPLLSLLDAPAALAAGAAGLGCTCTGVMIAVSCEGGGWVEDGRAHTQHQLLLTP